MTAPRTPSRAIKRTPTILPSAMPGGMRPAPTAPLGGGLPGNGGAGGIGSTPPARRFTPQPGEFHRAGTPATPADTGMRPAPAQPVDRAAVLAELRARLGGTSGGPAMMPPRRRPVIRPTGSTS